MRYDSLTVVNTSLAPMLPSWRACATPGIARERVFYAIQSRHRSRPCRCCCGCGFSCHHCGIPGHYKANCRKLQRELRQQPRNVPNNVYPTCETCGRKSHETKDCYSGANWANRPTWWRTQPQHLATYPNNIPAPAATTQSPTQPINANTNTITNELPKNSYSQVSYQGY